MKAHRLGYPMPLDPEAVVVDPAAAPVDGAFTRRVRLAVGSFRELRHFMGMRCDAAPLLAFFCHKGLRWVLPFSMIRLLARNWPLWGSPLYRATKVGQPAFYTWAAGGFPPHKQVSAIHFALRAYYVVAMHLAFLVGLIKHLFARQDGTWQRVEP